MMGSGLWLAMGLLAAAQDGKPDLTVPLAAEQAGRWADAETLYRQRLSQRPADPDINLGLARTLEALNSPESSLAFYLHPSLDDSPEAVAGRARLLLLLERYTEAVDAFRMRIALEGESLGALLGLAKSFEGAGQYLQAGQTYQDVLAAHPGRLDVRLSLGRTWEQAGRRSAAIDAYQPLLTTDGDSPYPRAERLQIAAAAAEQLAPLLVEVEEWSAAAEVYLLLPGLRPGADPSPWYRAAAQALCAHNPNQARDLFRHLGSTSADAAVVMCVADAFHERGNGESASEAYRKVTVIASQPGVVVADDDLNRAIQRLSAFQLEAEAGRLSLVADAELSSVLRAQVHDAQRAARAGRQNEALTEMRSVVAAARHSSEAWASLGDMQADFGQVGDAELSYRVAITIAPDDVRWRTRLAMLLAEAYAGTRHEEAIFELSRAIDGGPHPPETRFQRGVLFLAFREFDAAAKDLDAYLTMAPQGEHAVQAEQLLANLHRSPPEILPPELPERAIQDVSAEAEQHFRLARVYMGKSDSETALREVQQALALAPDWQMALELYGDLAWSSGQHDAALEAWETALQTTPAPPGLLVKLALVYTLRGDEQRAEGLLIQAAEVGSVEAYAELAQMAHARGNRAEARRWLERFFAAASGGPDYQTALALLSELDAERNHRRLVLGGGGGVVLIGGLLLIHQHRRRRILVDLLEMAPECSHDVARLLSAVRHEVLKHNTTLLEEMAYALENRDFSAVSWAAERLFDEEGGAVHRFGAYRSAIERLGRKQGVILDLKWRDPIFGPMSRAFRSLANMQPALLDAAPSVALVEELRHLHAVLNIWAYRELGVLIQTMGTLVIDDGLLRSVDARVRAEPKIADSEFQPLHIEGAKAGIPARVFQGDFEDIVANLLRNAYLASAEHLPVHRRQVGLFVEEDDDPITGVALVALRFCDQAPGKLTSEKIHSRSIGRGLGLTADLIARHNGSIDVEMEVGWKKAVVVRLPRAEGEEGMDMDDVPQQGEWS